MGICIKILFIKIIIGFCTDVHHKKYKINSKKSDVQFFSFLNEPKKV